MRPNGDEGSRQRGGVPLRASGFAFQVEATDGRARAGRLTTPHGEVETPCFMPVGTKATVKAVSPRDLAELGAGIVLANTYHLYFRPGVEIVERHGGLHGFMCWDGPILTDSGGFQVFSLADTRVVREDGVEFSSVYDGSRHVFTPRLAMDVQQRLGADIVMCFDECAPGTATRDELAAAVERTTRWAAACRAHHERRDQLLLGIAQGGTDEELRRRSAAELQEIGFDGYAIGGLSVGERGDDMLATVDLMDELLPDDRLRYFMGIGDPRGIIEVIRPRCRRLRLRLAHAHGPHRHGAHALRPPQPAKRALRGRPRAAGRGLRLLRLPQFHAGLSAASGHAEGDPGVPAAQSAQPESSDSIDRRCPRRHPCRAVR